MNRPLLVHRLRLEGHARALDILSSLHDEVSVFLPPVSFWNEFSDAVVRDWIKFGRDPAFSQFIGQLLPEEKFIFFCDHTVRCALSKREVDKLIMNRDWISLTRSVWRRINALK